MSKKSLKSRIFNFLRSRPNEYIHKGVIEDLARQAGYLADNAGRRCRELCFTGSRVRKKEVNGSVMYAFIPEEIIIDPLTRTARILEPVQPSLYQNSQYKD